MADDPEEQQEFIRRLTALPYTCSTSLMTSWILPRSEGKMELELGPVKLDEL